MNETGSREARRYRRAQRLAERLCPAMRERRLVAEREMQRIAEIADPRERGRAWYHMQRTITSHEELAREKRAMRAANRVVFGPPRHVAPRTVAAPRVQRAPRTHRAARRTARTASASSDEGPGSEPPPPSPPHPSRQFSESQLALIAWFRRNGAVVLS